MPSVHTVKVTCESVTRHLLFIGWIEQMKCQGQPKRLYEQSMAVLRLLTNYFENSFIVRCTTNYVRLKS